MKEEKRRKKLGKFLSLVLRHKPEIIQIELDKEGWTSVSTLIQQMNKNKLSIDFETLEIIVLNNDKQRYSFNEDRTKIRANQGHSINLDLGFVAKNPPSVLYHGTATKSIESITKLGIKKMNRHHVHLSADLETATKVGQRHGKLVIYEINTESMLEDGFQFYQSENGVWLVDEVPVIYIKELNH